MEGWITHEKRSDKHSNPETRSAGHIDQLGAFPFDSDVAVCAEDPSDTLAKEEISDSAYAKLIRTFNIIFQLHQRSEDIRAHLEKVDHALLTCRTVRGLMLEVTRILREDLDLVSARILVREDHPIIALIDYDPPLSVGTCSSDILDNGNLPAQEPYILDDLSGELAENLFGPEAALLASAAIAHLATPEDRIGLLCLGSNDPARYSNGMKTDLISSLAAKISLGLFNAWSHEQRGLNALHGWAAELFSEQFFLEILRHEFDRSWRYERPFTLMAASWRYATCDEGPSKVEVAHTLKQCLRSGDVVANGDDVMLWVLLPETKLPDARSVAQRLHEIADQAFLGDMSLFVGLAEFTQTAVVPSMLLREARLALREAETQFVRAEYPLLDAPSFTVGPNRDDDKDGRFSWSSTIA